MYNLFTYLFQFLLLQSVRRQGLEISPIRALDTHLLCHCVCMCVCVRSLVFYDRVIMECVNIFS